MATIMDLAEQYDLSPSAVEQWLRKNGMGRPKGHLSAGAERAFRAAHDGGRSLQALFIDHPRRAPAPRRAARTVPAAPPPRAPPASRNHYKKRFDDLLETHRALVAERDELRLALAKAQAQAQTPAAPKPAPRPETRPPPEPTGETLRSALEAAGLYGAAARSGLRALAVDDARCDALLDTARIDTLDPLEALAQVCRDGVCRKVAAADRLVPVEVIAAHCVVCRGSANRRWWHWMARCCARKTMTRVLIIGGSDDTHAAIGRLQPDTPMISVELVDGTSHQTRQRARTKVRGADLVVLWSSTQLDHKVSDLYRHAADNQRQVRRVSVREGGRGITALAQSVVSALER